MSMRRSLVDKGSVKKQAKTSACAFRFGAIGVSRDMLFSALDDDGKRIHLQKMHCASTCKVPGTSTSVVDVLSRLAMPSTAGRPCPRNGTRS